MSDRSIHSLVLSLFPGIDLLGRGFEDEGFVIVRGPDLLWGGDIERFHIRSCIAVFTGIIGGPPCQDFSKSRRNPPTVRGIQLIKEFFRLVKECQPVWWLMENVAGSPNVTELEGYDIQSFTLNARECGLRQNRLRKFHFGYRDRVPIVISRSDTVPYNSAFSCAMAGEGDRGKHRRNWEDFCEMQGLPRTFKLPGVSRRQAYRMVGNGVPIPMAAVIARAIRNRCEVTQGRLCVCGCGRLVVGRARMARASCRKRMERRRRDLAGAIYPGTVTAGESQLRLVVNHCQ